MMINIVIDTNIFRKNPQRNNAAFSAIKLLAENHKIKIYMPYVIEEEFLSQQINERDKSIDAVTKGFETLIRKNYSDELLDDLRGQHSNFSTLKERLSSYVRKEFDKWCNELGVEKVPLTLKQTKNAFSNYFEGRSPYQSLKNRKYIPDSIIFESIKEIKEREDKLLFISEDVNIGKHCSKLNVEVYKRLEDFIETDEIQTILIEHRNFSDLASFLKESVDLLEDVLTIDSKLFESKTIYDYSFKSDSNDAEIAYADNPSNIDFDFSNLTYYGNSLIGFNMSFNIDANLHLFIFKSDYYAMEEEGYSSIEDWNDHYFLVEKDTKLNIEGTATIEVNIEKLKNTTDPIDFSTIVNFETIKIDSIDTISLDEYAEKKNLFI